MPRISVIIPTYNRADIVGEAIQSVFDQTYSDWELIVVDDGSTDETAQVVAQFSERVIYIYQDNAGVAAARNAGFAASRGEFVSFLDSDDRMLPHNLELLVALLDARPEVGVAYGWYYWMDASGQPYGGPRGVTFEGYILPQLVLEEKMMIGTTLIRRACVEAVGGVDETCQYQQHWDFFLRVARAGYTYAFIKQAVALLRVHPGNRSRDMEAMLEDRLAILDRLFNDPALGTTLGDVRHQAYYKAYIHFTLDHYELGHFRQATNCLNEALQYAPLQSNDLTKISEAIIHHALAPEVSFPLKFARDLLKPISLTVEVRRLRSKVLGQISAELAFRQVQVREAGRVWRYALGAVIHDPSWLRNRGLMRIGLEDLAGRGVMDWIRSE